MGPETLVDEQTVEARFSKRDTPDGCSPEWSEWETVTLFIRRREKDLPKARRKGQNWKKGDLIELAINEKSWASYTQSDYCEDYDEWLCEEYRMQIRKAS